MNNAETRETGLEKPSGIFYGWVVLSIAFITLVLGYAIRNTFSVFYPTIVQEFGWGRGNTALMFSISIIVYGLVAPVAGSLLDRFGPRLVLPVGAFIVGGGVALCSTATAQWHFYLFYGGLGAAGLSLAGWTPLTAIVSNWFVKRRGLAFGILGAGKYVQLFLRQTGAGKGFYTQLPAQRPGRLSVVPHKGRFPPVDGFHLCPLLWPGDRHCGPPCSSPRLPISFRGGISALYREPL